MKQQMLLKQDVVNGFSYSFTTRLLIGLKKLIEANEVYVEKNSDETTPDAAQILYYLSDQIEGASVSPSNVTKEKLDVLIKTTERFLDLFKKDFDPLAPSGPIEKGIFTIRVQRILHKLGISTWEQLANTTEEILQEQNMFGTTSLSEVKMRLSERGIELKKSE